MGPPITSRPLIFYNLHYHVQTDIGNELVHQIRRNLDTRGATYCPSPCDVRCGVVFVKSPSGAKDKCFSYRTSKLATEELYYQQRKIGDWDFDSLCTHLGRRGSEEDDPLRPLRKHLVGVGWVDECIRKGRAVYEGRFNGWEILTKYRPYGRRLKPTDARPVLSSSGLLTPISPNQGRSPNTAVTIPKVAVDPRLKKKVKFADEIAVTTQSTTVDRASEVTNVAVPPRPPFAASEVIEMVDNSMSTSVTTLPTMVPAALSTDIEEPLSTPPVKAIEVADDIDLDMPGNSTVRPTDDCRPEPAAGAFDHSSFDTTAPIPTGSMENVFASPPLTATNAEDDIDTDIPNELTASNVGTPTPWTIGDANAITATTILVEPVEQSLPNPPSMLRESVDDIEMAVDVITEPRSSTVDPGREVASHDTTTTSTSTPISTSRKIFDSLTQHATSPGTFFVAPSDNSFFIELAIKSNGGLIGTLQDALFIIIDISTDPKAIRGPDIQEILANMDKKTQLPLSRKWIEQCTKTGQIVDMEPYVLKLSSTATSILVAPASPLSEDSEMEVIDLTIDAPDNSGQERPPDTSTAIVEPKPWSPFVPATAKRQRESASTDTTPSVVKDPVTPPQRRKKIKVPNAPCGPFNGVARPNHPPAQKPQLKPSAEGPYLTTRGSTPADQARIRPRAPKLSSLSRNTAKYDVQELIYELDNWLNDGTETKRSRYHFLIHLKKEKPGSDWTLGYRENQPEVRLQLIKMGHDSKTLDRAGINGVIS